MGTEILNTHQINTYRTKEHDLLMDIRQGKFTYDELFRMVESYESEFTKAALTTILPDEPDEKKVENLLVSFYEDCYTAK